MKSKIMILALSLAATAAAAQVEEPADANTSHAKPKVEIFKYVDQMPEAPYDIAKFLSENIVYPDTAIKADVEGRVAVQFVVDKTGKVTDVKPTGNRRFGYGLEEEAVRVVKAMPTWKPGKQNGVPVSVYYTLPIMFKLTDADKK